MQGYTSGNMSNAALNLPAYLARIGYSGPVEPTLPVLQQLIEKHTTAIPLENLDVLLGRRILIDVESVQQKMVARRRGGYCYEHNTLFRAALEAIGFKATPRLGRVVYRASADKEMPRTHMVLLVAIPGDSTSSDFAAAEAAEEAAEKSAQYYRYLVDVSFGGLTPIAPLELHTQAEQYTPCHEVFRLVPYGPDGEELLLQARNRDPDSEWFNIYRVLHGEHVYPCDMEAANWVASTMPGHPSNSSMMMALAPADGRRITLLNGRLTVRSSANGQVLQRSDVRSPEQLREVLASQFGLHLSQGESEHLAAKLDRLLEQQAAAQAA